VAITESVQVLAEDPDLADDLSGERLQHALEASVATAFEHRTGAWSPPPFAEVARGGIGLLILNGLVVRQVGVAGRFGAELLGVGDLMCPWQWDDGFPSLPRSSQTRVLRQCRLAVLDTDFTERIGHYPEVLSALFTRALQRARHISVNMAIVQQPRIDIRLHMLFWELADRFGTVRHDGVHVPITLTHATLSDLVAARRPTVTKALGELAEHGSVLWTGQDWLLPGEPPAELQAVGSVSVGVTDVNGGGSGH
jgi:CRP/FNR family cyclic AMP-dependent transcriptional regulator